MSSQARTFEDLPAKREVPLTQGKVALVDAQDFSWVSQWKWFAHRIGRSWYAGRNLSQQSGIIHLHRALAARIGMDTSLLIDHRDGNGLNCCRGNIRAATRAGNNRNTRRRIDNKSGLKGVSFHAKLKKWRARIQVDGRQVFLGCFTNKRTAAMVYDSAAREYFGEFARPNLPRSDYAGL